MLYSPAAQTGGQGDGGTLAFGLFGAVNVEPVGAEYYRSQLTNAVCVSRRWYRTHRAAVAQL